jgi:hypothetical protein
MWAALDDSAVIVTSVLVIVAFMFSVGISATPEHTPTRQPLPLALGRIGVWQRLWRHQDLGVFLPSPDTAWSTPRRSRSIAWRGGGRQRVREGRARHDRQGHWLGIFVVDATIPWRMRAGR